MTRFQNVSSLALIASTLGACSGASIADEALAVGDGIGTTAERAGIANSGSAGAAEAPRFPTKPKGAPLDDGLVGPDGYASFVLGRDSTVPAVVKTLPDDLVRTPTGFRIDGTLLVTVPGGDPIELRDAEVAGGASGPARGLDRIGHRLRQLCQSPEQPADVCFPYPRALACWGGNYLGQLGDGTRTTRSEPGLVGDATRVGNRRIALLLGVTIHTRSSAPVEVADLERNPTRRRRIRSPGRAVVRNVLPACTGRESVPRCKLRGERPARASVGATHPERSYGSS